MKQVEEDQYRRADSKYCWRFACDLDKYLQYACYFFRWIEMLKLQTSRKSGRSAPASEAEPGAVRSDALASLPSTSVERCSEAPTARERDPFIACTSALSESEELRVAAVDQSLCQEARVSDDPHPLPQLQPRRHRSQILPAPLRTSFNAPRLTRRTMVHFSRLLLLAHGVVPQEGADFVQTPHSQSCCSQFHMRFMLSTIHHHMTEDRIFQWIIVF